MLEYNNDTKVYKISYLLLADTIERLDMILLELRHLQRNIIYSMREPGFNAPLRFEENFLWGNEWDDFFRESTTEDEDSVINEHILHFPAPDSLVEFSKEFRSKAGYLVHQDAHVESYYDIKKIEEEVLASLQVIQSEKIETKKDKKSFFNFTENDLNIIKKIIEDIEDLQSTKKEKQDTTEKNFEEMRPILLRKNLCNMLRILDKLSRGKALRLGFSEDKINNVKKMTSEFLKIISEGTKLGDLKEEDKKTAKDIFEEMRPILIQINLNIIVYHLWNKTGWRISYKRHYENLRGTQLLKKLIVRDKFKLCRFALTHADIVAGKHHKTTMDQGALARFIILRSAIHARCNQYLERIMEYQSMFSKVLDIGVKEFPMPSTERRREIGIYMDFLNDRVNRIHEETAHLIEHLGIPTQKNEDSKDKHDEPIILHSWKHHFTAEHQIQEDAIGRSLRLYTDDKKQYDLYHITTSYWMPERMDLQPIIGHETAHLALHQYFDNLSDMFLQHSQANFVTMQRSLLRVLTQYDRILGIGKLSPVHKPHALLREISCDFLAASVKGFSYLYALLLESIGIGLHKYLLYGNFESGMENADLLDLDLVYALEGTGGHSMTMRRDWWLRLKLVIFWLKRIHHWQPSGLDIILLEGTDSLLDNLLVFFDRITLQPEDRKGELWNALFERLCDEIEISKAVMDVRQWRAERSHATEKTPQEQQNDPFSPSIRRFPDQVRKALKEIQIGMKIKKGKALARFLEETTRKYKITDDFNSVYLIDKPFSYTDKDEIVFSAYSGHRGFTGKDFWAGAHLHGYLYDIPWTCAMTRTIDLFGYDESILKKRMEKGSTKEAEEKKKILPIESDWLDWYKNAPVEKTLEALSEDNALGRELYSLALEFHMATAEAPPDRLVHIRHLLRTHDKMRKRIQYIIDKKEKKGDKSWDKMITFWASWKNEIKGILLPLPKDREKYKEAIRKANKSMKEALELTQMILQETEKEIDQNQHDTNLKNDQSMFVAIINYLKFYEKEDDHEKSITNEITRAITSLHKSDECHLFKIERDGENNKIRCFRMILVSRYAIGGYYAMQSESKYDAFTDRTKLTPVKMLKGDTYWSTENKKCNKEKRREGNKDCIIYPLHKTQYCNVLGRYDALSFTRTRPLCRCSLPHFSKGSPYQFTSLLTRREFGIRIDLNLDEEKKCTEHINREKEYGLVGAVSIILKRRSLRMPFLARLLASVQKEERKIQRIRPEKRLTGDKLDKEKDTVLLLDGSVDFLLVFCEDYKAKNHTDEVLKRVGHVLDAAYWLFQDFMVERTEIIFDAIVLDYVAKKIVINPESELSIECKIRFFEDQFLDYSLEDFRERLFKRIEKTKPQADEGQEEKGKKNQFFMVMAELTPGRMDMTLRLFNAEFINEKFTEKAAENKGKWYFKSVEDETFRDQLTDLLEPEDIDTPPRIDRVEITVSKRPPKPRY